MKGIEKVAVIGLGALGIMYADFFTQAHGSHSVTVIADECRIRRYRARQICCNGNPCTFSFETPDKYGKSADLVIVAVKATALNEVLEHISCISKSDTVIISVLNGITSEDIIESHVSEGTVIDCVSVGMDTLREGLDVTYSKIGFLSVGIKAGEQHKQEALKRLESFFDRTHFVYRHEQDIRHRMWSKWMLNVGINQVVMVEQGTFATVQREGKARERMIGAMREVIAVAKCEGMDLGESDIEEYMALLADFMPNGMPSMRQDGVARRYSEVECFSGELIKRARHFGVSVPINEALYREIRYVESKY